MLEGSCKLESFSMQVDVVMWESVLTALFGITIVSGIYPRPTRIYRTDNESVEVRNAKYSPNKSSVLLKSLKLFVDYLFQLYTDNEDDIYANIYYFEGDLQTTFSHDEYPSISLGKITGTKTGKKIKIMMNHLYSGEFFRG